MSWLIRYRINKLLRYSSWFPPLLGLFLALMAAPLIRYLDEKTQWSLFNYDVEGARAILGVLAGAMLTFVLFLFTMLLLAVQIASSQLTPRVIAGVFRSRPIRMAAGIFIFNFVFCIAIMARIQDVVPQLPVSLGIVFSIIGIVTFLYVVDYSAKSLRPISVLIRIGKEGRKVIEEVYPRLLTGPSLPVPSAQLVQGKEFTPIRYPGNSGVLMALDLAALQRLAIKYDGVIALIPQVGDFISRDDRVLRLYGGAAQIPLRKLLPSLIVGDERTMAQDPAFAFRMLVDIAIRALSPAINDPTTAVLSLDQIQLLLFQVGIRRLKDEGIYDEAKKLRLLIGTPNWEDFVHLSMREVRWYGANSFQVSRRLKAMLVHLMKQLPEERLPALERELQLLNGSTEKNFPDPGDREQAEIADFQGLGGTHR